jgi:hypothetical protein
VYIVRVYITWTSQLRTRSHAVHIRSTYILQTQTQTNIT